MNTRLLSKNIYRLWAQIEKKLMALPLLDHPYARKFQEHQNWAYLALGFLFCLLSFQLHLFPGYQSLNASKARNLELIQQIRLLEAQRARMLSQQRSIQNDIARMEGRLFSPGEALQFSNVQLPRIIQGSGSRTETIQRRPQTQVNELIYELPIDIRISGSTASLGKALGQLHRYSKLVGVRNLVIDSDSKGTVGLSATLGLFYALN